MLAKRLGCIYRIVSPSGKVYIGQSFSLKDRVYRYSNLKCKNQRRLYSSLLKYGWHSHFFSIVCSGSYYPEHLNKLEQDFIAHYKSNVVGLNISSGGNLNSYHSQETKAKMSESGKIRSEAHRAAIRKQNKERIFSDDTRKKMSLSAKAKIVTQQHRDNIKKNHVNTLAKLVLDLETGIYYDNGNLASIAKGINRHTLKNMLNGNKRNKTQLIYA